MKNSKFITVICALLIISSFSCKKKEEEPVVENKVKSVATNHKWYYFGDTDIISIDKPQNVPAKASLPWTEAVRISSANTSGTSDINTGKDGIKAYALVNRLGMLCFENKKFTLAKDISLFTDRTAENLVFFNDTPIFSVYKSSFFNDTILSPDYKIDDSQHYFLLQFDDLARISYPLVNSNNLTDLSLTEVVDYIWDGKNWICSLKSLGNEKIGFSYVKWTPTVPLLSLSPVNASEKIVITSTDVTSYRNLKAEIPYSDSPERVKKLLAGFSAKIPFSIDVKTAGGYSTRSYINQIPNSTEQELKANAIIADSWSAALFEDGTLFIEGALPGKHILRGGKPIAIRLPKLPPQFVYSDFVISGTTLYAAWEETSFYKTSRSGFLCVDLDETLYKKIR